MENRAVARGCVMGAMPNVGTFRRNVIFGRTGVGNFTDERSLRSRLG